MAVSPKGHDRPRNKHRKSGASSPRKIIKAPDDATAFTKTYCGKCGEEDSCMLFGCRIEREAKYDSRAGGGP